MLEITCKGGNEPPGFLKNVRREFCDVGGTIAPKLLYGRKECDLGELLTPLAIHTLLYSHK